MKARTQKSVPRPLRRRVFLVNGAANWHAALTSLINRALDLEVCGEAFDEKTALEQVNRLQPDLVLSEILRRENLGFIRELHRRYPQLPILAFSFRDEESYAPRALEAGACGYLMKNIVGETLLAGIRNTLKGRRVLSLVMQRRLRRPQKRRQTESRQVGKWYIYDRGQFGNLVQPCSEQLRGSGPS